VCMQRERTNISKQKVASTNQMTKKLGGKQTGPRPESCKEKRGAQKQNSGL
jgi:hypothetical protein